MRGGKIMRLVSSIKQSLRGYRNTLKLSADILAMPIAPRNFIFYPLSREEKCYYVSEFHQLENTAFLLQQHCSAGYKISIIVGWSWTVDIVGKCKLIRRQYNHIKSTFPDVDITFLGNSGREYALLAKAGLPAVEFNKNAFLHASIYNKPVQEVSSKYDAVLTASMASWKRHQLAKDVARLALVHAKPSSNEEVLIMGSCSSIPIKDQVPLLRNTGALALLGIAATAQAVS